MRDPIAEAEARLSDLHDRLVEANARRASVMEEIREAVREADRLGIPRTRIIDLTGVARQTVYDALTVTEE